MNFENWSASYKKWERDLWKEMEDFRKETSSYTRLQAWNKVVWIPCGFCIESQRVCTRCLLYKKYCYTNLQRCIEWKNTMGKLYTAWESNNKEEFRRLQREFLLVISNFEPKKDEDNGSSIGIVVI